MMMCTLKKGNGIAHTPNEFELHNCYGCGWWVGAGGIVVRGKNVRFADG